MRSKASFLAKKTGGLYGGWHIHNSYLIVMGVQDIQEVLKVINIWVLIKHTIFTLAPICICWLLTPGYTLHDKNINTPVWIEIYLNMSYENAL